jgi:vanillate O-demethylase monooxygenase subunit
MITAQARNIAIDPAVPMLPLAMDSALTQYRRIVERALQSERSSAAVHQ